MSSILSIVNHPQYSKKNLLEWNTSLFNQSESFCPTEDELDNMIDEGFEVDGSEMGLMPLSGNFDDDFATTPHPSGPRE